MKYLNIIKIMMLYFLASAGMGFVCVEANVKNQLSEMGIAYESEKDNFLRVVLDTKEGRSQQVYIELSKNHGTYSFIRIHSAFWVWEGSLSVEELDAFLRNSGKRLGYFCIREIGDIPQAQFVVDLPGVVSTSDLKSVLQLVADMADALEKARMPMDFL